jgi:hypothetical protein
MTISILVAGFGLAVSLSPAWFSLSAQQANSGRGRKYKAPPPTSRVVVSVVRDTDGKPVENAAVIFHLVGEKGNMELKSNEDGKAVIDVLPTNSSIRLQIIANGYQTYGEDYKIADANMAIDVRMKRPGEQYSIYKAHEVPAETEKKAEPEKEQPSTPAPAK